MKSTIMLNDNYYIEWEGRPPVNIVLRSYTKSNYSYSSAHMVYHRPTRTFDKLNFLNRKIQPPSHIINTFKLYCLGRIV